MTRFIVRWEGIEAFDEFLTLGDAARFGRDTEVAGNGTVDLIHEVEIDEDDGHIHYEVLWSSTLGEALYAASITAS